MVRGRGFHTPSRNFAFFLYTAMATIGVPQGKGIMYSDVVDTVMP